MQVFRNCTYFTIMDWPLYCGAHLLVEYMFMNQWKEFGTCFHLGIRLRASVVRKRLAKADECYCVGVVVCEDNVYGYSGYCLQNGTLHSNGMEL
jgi:hypothetical protein